MWLGGCRYGIQVKRWNLAISAPSLSSTTSVLYIVDPYRAEYTQLRIMCSPPDTHTPNSQATQDGKEGKEGDNPKDDDEKKE